MHTDCGNFKECEVMTIAEEDKIRQNEQEEKEFVENLHKLIGGDRMLASRPLVIGKTPYIIALCNKNMNVNNDLVITKRVISKCMRPSF